MRRVRGFNERRALEARKRPSFFEASAVNVEGGRGGGGGGGGKKRGGTRGGMESRERILITVVEGIQRG